MRIKISIYAKKRFEKICRKVNIKTRNKIRLKKLDWSTYMPCPSDSRWKKRSGLRIAIKIDLAIYFPFNLVNLWNKPDLNPVSWQWLFTPYVADFSYTLLPILISLGNKLDVTTTNHFWSILKLVDLHLLRKRKWAEREPSFFKWTDIKIQIF